MTAGPPEPGPATRTAPRTGGSRPAGRASPARRPRRRSAASATRPAGAAAAPAAATPRGGPRRTRRCPPAEGYPPSRGPLAFVVMSDLVTGDAVVLELRLAKLASRSLALAIDVAVQLPLLLAGTFVVAGVVSGVDD